MSVYDRDEQNRDEDAPERLADKTTKTNCKPSAGIPQTQEDGHRDVQETMPDTNTCTLHDINVDEEEELNVTAKRRRTANTYYTTDIGYEPASSSKSSQQNARRKDQRVQQIATALSTSGLAVQRTAGRNAKVRVTESNIPTVPIGTPVSTINGIDVTHLKNADMRSMLSSGSVDIQFSRDTKSSKSSRQLANRKDRQNEAEDRAVVGSGMLVKRSRGSSHVRVTHSTNPDMPVGEIVSAINGIDVGTLSNREMTQLLQSDNANVELRSQMEAANKTDAVAYAKQYNLLTRFELCAVCGIEDSQIKMKPLDSEQYKEALQYLHQQWQELTQQTGEHYAVLFTAVLRQELPNGRLPDASHICDKCAKDLNSTKQKRATTPKYALLRGLYPGAVPLQLQGLTAVEQSMIAIYSTITKTSLQAGRYQHAKRGTTYTIVNDVASVATYLPRAPDMKSFAVLRKQKPGGQLSKEFTFRPRVVRDALLWLKQHNHLYQKIPLVWYSEDGLSWASEEPRDIPHVDLSSDEVDAADEELNMAGVTDVAEKESEILLLTETTPVSSSLAELRAIIVNNASSHAKAPDACRSSNTTTQMPIADITFVTPYGNPEYFFSKAFPCLFPYGRGCPADPMTVVTGVAEHANLMLRRGTASLRRFQHCSNYYFSVYTYEMKRKVGGVAYQAQNEAYNDSNPTKKPPVDCETNDVTAAQMADIINHILQPDVGQSQDNSVNPDEPVATRHSSLNPGQIKHYINRMVPYAKSLAGTSLHMAFERRNLLAMLGSSVVRNQGSWRWFVTFAPADWYELRLFEIIAPVAADGNNDELWELRSSTAKKLNLTERQQLLHTHPALAARLFDLKQSCLWDKVIQGKSAPLGIVTDAWSRVEFQMRGSPHVHALIAVAHNGNGPSYTEDASQSDIAELAAIVESAVTAKLVERPHGSMDELPVEVASDPIATNQFLSEELDYYYNIPWDGYFEDHSDPRKIPFDPSLNYWRKADGAFMSPEVQSLYRRLQLANQMHRCNRTCWKYLLPNEPHACRFGFPFVLGERSNPNSTVFLKERDHRARIRVHVLPARNNAHVNNTAFAPLLAIAHGGNHDIKCIDNVYGSAEYAASYASKPEAADFNVLRNLLAKKLIHCSDDRDVLRAVAQALLQSTQVGAVEVCYSLLGLKFVNNSRCVINVNALHRSQMRRVMITNEAALDHMDENESVLEGGPGSQLGRRRAYERLINQQRTLTPPRQTFISFYQLLTYFSLQTAEQHRVFDAPGYLSFNNCGELCNPPQKFQIHDTVYTLRGNPAILNLAPHIPMECVDDRSCYAALLLHLPWPHGGEANLLEGKRSAVEAYRAALAAGRFAEYVLPTIDCMRQSTLRLNSQPEPTRLNEEDAAEEATDSSDDEFYNPAAELNEVGVTATTEDAIRLTEEIVSGAVTENVAINISYQQRHCYTTFLSRAMLVFQQEYAAENQADDMLSTVGDSNNKAVRLQLLSQQIAGLRTLQRCAYERATAHICGTKQEQLIMFLTGEGGTGKSKVIECITEYCRATFGKQLGQYGAVVVTAPTGTAAHNISGYTWQSVLGRSINGDHGARTTSSIISPNTARMVGARIRGAKLFIIDEVSLLSLESLHIISESLKRALCANTDDSNEKEYIMSQPFGGMHVLFGGDLWQLRCVQQTPVYESNPTSAQAKEGRKLWKQINEYVELTENCRFLNAEISLYAQFLHQARTAMPTRPVDNNLLDYMNQALVTGVNDAISQAKQRFGPNVVWIAETNQQVTRFNRIQLLELAKQGRFVYRCVARHTPVNSLEGTPTATNKAALFGIYDKDCMTHVDIAVGARVRCTRNIATQLGIYNGAAGTVVGFGFTSTTVPENLPKVENLHNLVNRETPIVFVKMDKYNGVPLCPETPTVVPFTELQSSKSFKVNGQRFYRWQLPLALSFAITAHKAQSITAHDGAVFEPSLGAPFARSLAYVSCSRSPDHSKFMLLRPLTHAHFESHAKERQAIQLEYARLDEAFPVCVSSEAAQP